MNYLRTALLDFTSKENGSVSLEVALWSPLIIAMFMVIVDFSYSMTLHANMWHATRTTARALSQHNITETESEAYLKSLLLFPDRDYRVQVEVSDREIQVDVELDGAQAALTPAYRFYGGGDYHSRIRMFREPV
jgi:hypothetical protein